MLAASVCSSSERVGESSTTLWNEAERALGEGPDLDLLVRRHRLVHELDLRLAGTACTGGPAGRNRWTPWTTRRSDPSGNLNILWMWVSVPTRWRSLSDRVVDGRVALGDDADDLALAHRVVDEGDGALPRHRERQDGVGEEDGVAERQDPELGRELVEVDVVDAVRLEVRLAVVPRPPLSRGRRPAGSRSPARAAAARRPSPRARRATLLSASSWQSRQSSAKGRALSRAGGISASHSSQTPYVPASSRRIASSILARVSDFICMRAKSTSWTKSSTLCSSASLTSARPRGPVSRSERSFSWISRRRSSSIALRSW